MSLKIICINCGLENTISICNIKPNKSRYIYQSVKWTNYFKCKECSYKNILHLSIK